MLMVQKYGGSSVATTEHIMNVAQRIVESYKQNNDGLVVVLSAMGQTTNELISQALAVNPDIDKRELDMLLVTGEQQTCALMAMAIKGLGYPAVSLNAVQAGIVTTSDFGNARIETIHTERILKEIANKNIVIVTGFQGIDENGEITTLGRGGSDTTAAALARALGAKTCEIYTDVDGVYTADPNLVTSAIKLNEITYNEMLELANVGAKVLHNRSVEIAKKANVNIIVKSSLTDGVGTIVKETTANNVPISGIAVDANSTRDGLIKLSVVGNGVSASTTSKLCEVLSTQGIEVSNVSTADIKISAWVPKDKVVTAAVCLHKKLIEKK